MLPHPALAGERLDPDEAALLTETFEPEWQAGQHRQMATVIGHLLREDYSLRQVNELVPDLLTGTIDEKSPGEGARNAAVLFSAAEAGGVNAKLRQDLADIGKKSGDIPKTALAALTDPRAAGAAGEAGDVELATPLPANDGQRAILQAAMTRRLTVAQGPPGTGKSQLVVNLVATALAHEQTVLIASNNNRAVDEVLERCAKLVPDSVIRTGSAAAQQTGNASLARLRTCAPPVRNPATARAALRAAAKQHGAALAEIAEAAVFEQKLLVFGREREQKAEALCRDPADLIELFGDDTRLADRGRKAGRVAGARFLGELRRRRMLRRIGWSDPSGTLDTSATCALLAAFAGTESAWRQTIRRKAEVGDDAALKSALEHAEAELAEASAAVLDAAVRTGARKGDKAIEAVLDTDPRRKKWVPRADLLRYVRAWAVTNQSARYFPPDPALFDLVIIDEASQCGIPGMLPLLFRAKRALVIGDPMQLPHITTIDAVEESRVRREAGLDAGRLERDRLAYRPNSAFHAAEHAAGDALLLDEHFRCHPAIAGFANRMFYKDELTVLTDVRGRPAVARPAVVWADVQGAAERIRGGSWRNPTEVAKVVASVRYLLEKLPDRGTVGVVTPYRAQQEAVVGALRKSGLADDPRVLVGTVHAFQGGERDAVVFTLVAGPGMRQSSVNRIARQADLWNVAVTRARSHLIVVGDAALWERQGGFGRALRQAAADAEGASGFAGEGPSDPLAQRLYEQLVKQGKDVGLGGAVNGYTADAVFDAAAGRQAVHLDRGAAEDTEPGRHLRLSLRRTDLLNDPVQGTTGLRIPAWTLYDVDSSR